MHGATTKTETNSLEVSCCLLLEVVVSSGTLIQIYQTTRHHILYVLSPQDENEKPNV